MASTAASTPISVNTWKFSPAPSVEKSGSATIELGMLATFGLLDTAAPVA
jgi:hypothetical protein